MTLPSRAGFGWVRDDVSMGETWPGTERFDAVVIGGGVVGTAVLRALSRTTMRRVALVEAAPDIGSGTSVVDTAILHTGFDTTPGTLEARLVAWGYELLGDYARATGIAVERTGAVLVAWDDEQVEWLPSLRERAEANGYHACRALTTAEVFEREPHLGPGALGGLAVPGEAIIDPYTPVFAFATEAVSNGAQVLRSTPVLAVNTLGANGHMGWELETPHGVITTDWLVNAAGLHADEIDRMVTPGPAPLPVTPRRGELVVYDKLARPLLRHIVLPVPTAVTTGVLVSPTVFGNVMVGPTAEDLTDNDDRSTTECGLAALVAEARRILPALAHEEITATDAGLRAVTELGDYQITVERDRRYACLAGIRSTGLTASMAIAEHLVAEMGLHDAAQPGGLGAPGGLAAPPTMANLGEAAARRYQASGCGPIMCHCERVTRSEILDALASDLPPVDLDGLRRRTRALAGRCQGDFCLAEVTALLDPSLSLARASR